jgi:hypothetical protein
LLFSSMCCPIKRALSISNDEGGFIMRERTTHAF